METTYIPTKSITETMDVVVYMIRSIPVSRNDPST